MGLFIFLEKIASGEDEVQLTVFSLLHFSCGFTRNIHSLPALFPTDSGLGFHAHAVTVPFNPEPIKTFPFNAQNDRVSFSGPRNYKNAILVLLIQINSFNFSFLFHLAWLTCKNHNLFILNPKFMGLVALCSYGSLVFYHHFSRFF
jgi:hypothetical protein